MTQLNWKQQILLVCVILFLVVFTILLIIRFKGYRGLTNSNLAVRKTIQGHSHYNQASYSIPKVIWTYWHTSNVTEFVDFNIKRWNRILGSTYEIRLIHDKNISTYISSSEMPANLSSYSKQHQADWIRLYLIKNYGGIWADSGILFNSLEALNEIHINAEQLYVDLAGFNIAKFQVLPQFPVIENWFFMAPKHSPLISLWLKEYEKALAMSFPTYRRYAEHELHVNSQRIFENQETTYLTCHLCLQTVLQCYLPDAKLYLLCAEDTMFRIQAEMSWMSWLIATVLNERISQRLPYIKLRGNDRQDFSVKRWKAYDEENVVI